MKIVLKGIVTREDAALAKKLAADGIIVSNHGEGNWKAFDPQLNVSLKSWKRLMARYWF
jgi:isopentenyl diphosphate isomerase/L-lactate dehydrogenase-like FMN-dependent dehydrogenase